MNFAETCFIFKSYVNIHWHELQDKPVISEISSVVRRRSALVVLQTLSKYSSFRQVEGRPDLGWLSHDVSPLLKHEYHSYTWVLLKASSLKASCSIKTVPAADFPNRKQNLMHTLCSLLSVIIKLPNFLAGTSKKSHNNNNSQPRLTPCGRLLEYCVDPQHLAAHCKTTSSLCTKFTVWLLLGPPSYYELLSTPAGTNKEHTNLRE